MEITCMRHALTRAVASRSHFTLLIRSIRHATGGAAQAPLASEKPAQKTVEDEKVSPVSSKAGKTEELERKPPKSERVQKAAETPPPKTATEAKVTAQTPPVVDKTAQLPLEPGKPAALPHRDGEKVISERILRLANEIASLTIFEVADLNSTLKKKLNLPDTPVFAQSFGAATSAGPASGAEQEETKEEKPQTQKTFFSVKLTKFDESKKIPLIKEIRAIVEGFNLVQAKKFVEALPATVKEDLSKNEAEELKTKLEKLGGVCEIV